MASVWLARFGGRLGFERLVVVKMILPEYSQDPHFQEMFLDEARIASRIEHANVARILDIGEHDGRTFLVMEWVDGDSLSRLLRIADRRKQRIMPGVALRIAADIAAGLSAAHNLKDHDDTHLGVVHRDVSPQNILVSNSGVAVLIDFGVAIVRDRASQETRAGHLKGKIRYMAPEQALGRSIDHRADLWALGVIVYEMFAGTTPFDAPNEVAMLHKLTSGEPLPPLPPSVPAAVRAIIDRTLAHEPSARFGSALELNLAIEAAMIEIGEPTSAATVAEYTSHLLADRQAARKRTVLHALSASRQRNAAGQADMQGQTSQVGQGAARAIEDATTQAASPPPSEPRMLLSSFGELGSEDAFREALKASSSFSLHGISSSRLLGEVSSPSSSATLGPSATENLRNSHSNMAPTLGWAAARWRTAKVVVLALVAALALVGGVDLIARAMKGDPSTDMPSVTHATTSVHAPPAEESIELPPLPTPPARHEAHPDAGGGAQRAAPLPPDAAAPLPTVPATTR